MDAQTQVQTATGVLRACVNQVEQVAQTTQATPGTTVWVYRNAIKGTLPHFQATISCCRLALHAHAVLLALPWYTTVREKLTDPAYGAWFLNFSGSGSYHVPQARTNLALMLNATGTRSARHTLSRSRSPSRFVSV
jgi:hypothetical protein